MEAQALACLTYVVAESHVDWDVHTCRLFVPRQLAPVSKIGGSPLEQAGHQDEARQHLCVSVTNKLSGAGVVP